MDQEDAHLGHVDDDVAGRVNDQHEVVPPGEVVGPGGPVLDSPVLKHLKIRFNNKNIFCNILYKNTSKWFVLSL